MINKISFIFYDKSPRNIRHLSREIIDRIPPQIEKIGVFVNAPIIFILEKIRDFNLDGIQLHGTETNAYCHQVKKAHPNKKIIKAFSVDDQFNFAQLEPYLNCCDYFLFDTKGQHAGGNGITFNWDILKSYPFDKPFFLSGGIDIDHVEEIKNLDIPQLFAIDVNSKFEIMPGLKDVEKAALFSKKLRASKDILT